MTQELQHKIENLINSNQETDDREITSRLKKLLYEIELENIDNKEAKSVSTLVAESILQLNEEASSYPAIETGFVDLDRLLGGFRPGELVVIGGRPSMGKTQLLVNLSSYISRRFPVLYFTFDLSAFLLTCRFLSLATEIPGRNLLRHNLDEDQKTRLSAVEEYFNARKLFISGDCIHSVEALKALSQKYIRERGMKVIVIDYLQMLNSQNRYHRGNRETEVSHIMRELKAIAKECNMCVIVSSQLSRSVESRCGSKRPQLSDLRESGAIEQDADKVLFIHRPEYYGFTMDENNMPVTGVAEIIVAKNRTGPTDTIRLLRDSEFTKFRDYEEDSADLNQFTFSEERLLELEKSPF
jgi:Replicative DNA helicase